MNRKNPTNSRTLKALGGLIVLSVLAFRVSLFAADDGAAFLKIDVDARAIGMGGAYTALAEGAGATYWNPAGLATTDRREASASHADWFSGMSHDHAAYVHPRIKGGSLGVSVTSLRATGIESRDDQRQAVGSFSAADTAMTLSYGRPFGDSHIGASVKVVEQRLGSNQARGLAADVGIIRSLPLRGMSLGVTAQNFGTKISFSEGRSYALPFHLKSGMGYSPSAAFSLAADVKYQVRESRWETACGAEFKPVGILALRAGYQLAAGLNRSAGSTSKSLVGFQGGFGLTLARNYQLDYAVLPFGELGNTQRVSFSAKF